jgi:hypothetical protein
MWPVNVGEITARRLELSAIHATFRFANVSDFRFPDVGAANS